MRHTKIIPFSSVIADDYGKLAIHGCYDEVELEHLWEGVNELGTTSNPVTFEGSLCFTKRLETAQAFVNPWVSLIRHRLLIIVSLLCVERNDCTQNY